MAHDIVNQMLHFPKDKSQKKKAMKKKQGRRRIDDTGLGEEKRGEGQYSG